MQKIDISFKRIQQLALPAIVASDSVPNSEIFPTTAASVEDNIGSAIPATIAGKANC